MTDLCGSLGNVVPLLQFRAFLFFYKESCRFLIPQKMQYIEKFLFFLFSVFLYGDRIW